jgi:hypothetical protein
LASAFTAEFPIAKTELSITEAEGHQVSDLRELLPAPGIPVNLNNTVEWSGYSSEDFTLMDICQDALPFDWSKVDVPGSPGLSRLFARLKIESESGIPALSLEKPESDEPSCLSLTEIQEVFHPNQKATTEHFCQARSSRAQNTLDRERSSQNCDVHSILGGISNLSFAGIVQALSPKYTCFPLRRLESLPASDIVQQLQPGQILKRKKGSSRLKLQN